MDSLQIAKKYLDRYRGVSDDPIVAASQEAEKAEYRELENQLSTGVKACEWLFVASDAVRSAYVLELEPSDGTDLEDVSAKVRELYQWWLARCDAVDVRIQTFEDLGYTIRNKSAYLTSKDKVLQKLRVYKLRDQAEETFDDNYFDGEFSCDPTQ